MKRFTSHRTKSKQPSSTPTASGAGALPTQAAPTHAAPTHAATNSSASAESGEAAVPADRLAASKDKELGGPDGLEPTRYGDWERKGICYDF